ncbi:SGNH/GDSL hydrolase family protein [Marinibaculum pumilum]|uniref:SGNH/GDSL hydrolase family protein n=1 Tax=Marinibaculum pumilum TaxID=1766165 RepID=A0ABV7L7L1_9PROT
MSEKRPTRAGAIAGTILLAAISVVLGLLLCEIGYRAFVYAQQPERFEDRTELPDSISVYDRSLWHFDERHGYIYPPGVEVGVTTVEDGVVASCGVISYINAQGNVGPPMDLHADPDFTIAVFGDSWTAAYDRGKTWPHLLQERLEERTGRSFNVYNFGRDGTGLIHMMRQAEEQLPKLKPDLAIIAFITDDIDRQMFWRTEAQIDGELRALTTLDPKPVPDPARSSDTVVVVADASHDWCTRTMGKRDETVEKIERVYRQRKANAASGQVTASLTTLAHSYIWNQVVEGDPLAFARPRFRASQNPRISAWGFEELEGFPETVAAVLASGVPVRLVHLAIYPEILEGREYLISAQQQRLLDSLHAMFGQEAAMTLPHADPPDDLMSINKSETDFHPSLRGMEFYGDAVADILIDEGLVPTRENPAPTALPGGG